MMTPKEVALTAVKALEEKKGLSIKLLRISDVSNLADYFLICTGSSNTHCNSLSGEVEKRLKEAGETLLHREGHRGGTWVLLDFGCVVVHIFTDETRKFYDLERLWNDAEPVDIDSI
jgi:ribosome-associated protein